MPCPCDVSYSSIMPASNGSHENTLAALGFTQPESLNVWPLSGPDNEPYRITPNIASSSGETLRHLALESAGIVCLSDFMTLRDRREGGFAGSGERFGSADCTGDSPPIGRHLAPILRL